jgi:hypothetical protein
MMPEVVGWVACGYFLVCAVVAAWQVWRTPAGDSSLCRAAATRAQSSRVKAQVEPVGEAA